MAVVQAEQLLQFAVNALCKVGLSEEKAATIGSVLVDADLRGIHSHGVHNLPRYARGFMQGHLNMNPSFPLIVDNGIFAIVDGEDSLGVLGADRAMDLAIERARQYGIAYVGVRNSSHFGAAYYYSKKALAHQMIGYSTTNGREVMAPWGGRQSLLSNNPFSYAIPAGKEPPIVFDIACSISARGRIRMMGRNNEPIPDHWAITKDGEPTTDPWEALGGSVLPFGGHKGYGLAVVNEIFSAALTGALFSFEQGQRVKDDSIKVNSSVQTAWRCGHLFGAIDISRFVAIEEFKERVDFMIQTFKSSPKAKDMGRIYLPGEMENENYEERIKSGIPLNEKTVQLLNEFARNEIQAEALAFS